MTWTADELDRIDGADELHIATPRADGSWRAAVPIWAVRVGDDVYVRTWQRRDTGWFGHAVRTGRARVQVPGVEHEVVVEDGGSDSAREAVDAAYRTKYGRYGAGTVGRMVGDDAADATLLLRG